MKNISLTELEKAVLRQGLSEGYIYDGTYEPEAKSHFLCWGFYGKRERGAAASLVKKGILNIYDEDGDTYVYLLISREEAEELSKKEAPEISPVVKVEHCGKASQERKIKRGWKLIVAENCRETPEELYSRLSNMGYSKVKVCWCGTMVKGFHSYFGFVR